MIVIGLLQEVLGILFQLLGNFVGIGVPQIIIDGGDGQLQVYSQTPTTTAKGNALTGAIADILTSGAQLVDLILQTLTGFAPTAAVGVAGTKV